MADGNAETFADVGAHAEQLAFPKKPQAFHTYSMLAKINTHRIEIAVKLRLKFQSRYRYEPQTCAACFLVFRVRI